MRVMKIGGVNALSSLLTDAKLLGTRAIKFGSPDLIILNSGGPATHLAENSILCGPANMRVVIRQPEGSLSQIMHWRGSWNYSVKLLH